MKSHYSDLYLYFINTFSLSHIVRLKEQNDQRIAELEADYAQMKIDDAEKLQKLKEIVTIFWKFYVNPFFIENYVCVGEPSK